MADGSTQRKPGTFTKGDKRINRKGRPKNFDALRRLALSVAHRDAKDADGQPLVVDDQTVTVIEAILMQWAESIEPTLQKSFVEIAFGKVPNVSEINATVDGPAVIVIDK